jgi:hypothetical protein
VFGYILSSPISLVLLTLIFLSIVSAAYLEYSRIKSSVAESTPRK